eukprot:1369578-Amorphochlora_amoeboformis.AAC.1
MDLLSKKLVDLGTQGHGYAKTDIHISNPNTLLQVSSEPRKHRVLVATPIGRSFQRLPSSSRY